jgi:two-component system NtrC family sensor kinase
MKKMNYATIAGAVPETPPQAHTQVTPDKNEERYKTFLDSIEDGCYELDLAGNMTFFNARLPEISGYSQEEMLGKNYRYYSDEQNAQILLKTYHDVFKTGNPCKGLQFELIRKDGSRVCLESSITLIRDSYGNPTGFRGIVRDISDRKRTQEALRESQQMLRLVLDTIPTRVFWKDKDLIYQGCNRQLALDAGFSSPEEIMGKDDFAFVWSDRAELYRADDRSVMDTGMPKLDYEEPVTMLDGGMRWVRKHKIPLLDAKDRVKGVLCTYEDITERKQMEDELRESREYLDAIINCMGDPVFVNDRQHRYVLVNKAFADLLGRSPDEIIGKTNHDFFPKEQVDFFWRFDDEVFETGKETTKEEFINNAHGQVLTVLTKKTLFTDKSGNKYIVGVIHDITDRKRTEEALRQSEKRFRLVAQSANDAFITFDSTGNILFWNVMAEKMFGYKAGEMLGKDITVIISKRFRDEFTNVMRMSIHAMKKVITSEFTPIGRTAQMMGLRKDAREFPVEISTSIWESEGKHLCTSIIRDITERKHMEDSLRREAEELRRARMEREKAYIELKTTQTHVLQQEKMASIGLLAAGVAHEINNPMGFISSNLGTLKKYLDKRSEYMAALERLVEQVKDQAAQAELKEKRTALKIDFIAEDIKDLIKESLEGADRVKKIVQDLKSFSRVDQSEYKHANINECIETTINIVWNELKYKATVNKEYGEIPLTKCYPQQLNQVFMNLLVNAAHAIEKQGVITIRTWREDSFILASITDTGCGMEPGIVNRIFEPFFTTKEVGKGTGLGLSITYDIVKKHGGEITVQSAPGKGTTFTVRIPLVEET